MQGKTNLLRPINSTTGNFFMFSQYAQDLTENFSQQDAYRVVPSKYVALNLNIPNSVPTGYPAADVSTWIGEIFQNYFENACCYLRQFDNWTPERSLHLIFQTLEKYHLISQTDHVSDNIVSIGDINISGYNTTADGMGYHEIYVYLANDTKKTRYNLVSPTSLSQHAYDSDYICGYEGDSYTGLSWKVREGSQECYTDAGFYGINISSTCLIPDILLTGNTEGDVEQEDAYFNVNSVLILYDVVNKMTNEVIHKNIPLGIYFTGIPVNGELTNTITKYVSNPDIFDQGTAYGLRICTRFLCTPSQTKFENVETLTTDDNDKFAELLMAFAENNSLMADIVAQSKSYQDDIKAHLASFRNHKTNVPYIRTIGQSKYWFVNGKNTGVLAEVVDVQTIQELIAKVDEFSEHIDDVIEQKIASLGHASAEDINTLLRAFTNIVNS